MHQSIVRPRYWKVLALAGTGYRLRSTACIELAGGGRRGLMGTTADLVPMVPIERAHRRSGRSPT